MSKIWSVHTINDGKWQVVLHIKEDQGYKYTYEPRPDIRAVIDANYTESPEVIARLLLDNVLHCEAVQVNMMCGPSVYMEK